MTKCFNCCGLEYHTDTCPNCGGRAYKVPIEHIKVTLPHVEIVNTGVRGFSSVGPVEYYTEKILTYAVDKRHVTIALCNPDLAVLFCRPEDAPHMSYNELALVLTNDPRRDFYTYHNVLYSERFYGARPVFVHHMADVHETALLYRTSVGHGTYIGPNCAIGVEGARLFDGMLVRHGGGVTIGNESFIGPGTVIVRGVWGNDTKIGNNCFIGNLVNIGHNCQIGDNVMILPGAVICGSVVIDDGVRISPNAVISDHVHIGEGAYVTLGSVVTKDVEKGEKVSGNFAVKHDKWIEFVKRIARNGKD